MRLAALAVAGTAVVGLLVWQVVEGLTGLPDDAALRVGGTVVTEAEFRKRLGVSKALHRAEPPADPASVDRFERDVAQATAVSLVVEQETVRRGLVASPAETDAAVTKLVDTRFGGRDAFRRELGRFGVSEPDAVGEVRRQLTRNRLFADVVRGIPPVTDADVHAAYVARRPVTPERRRLSNVVVETRERAEEVLAKAREGADLGALAVLYSRDETTGPTGGDLGELDVSQLEPPYAAAAFAAGPGEYFGPVQTRNGWNVGQVVSVLSAVPLTFEQVDDDLRMRLRTERETAAWEALLTDLARSADIDYTDRYRPADPAQTPAEPH